MADDNSLFNAAGGRLEAAATVAEVSTCASARRAGAGQWWRARASSGYATVRVLRRRR